VAVWPACDCYCGDLLMLLLCGCGIARQMPWLQLSDECLWSSSENAVDCFFLPAYSTRTHQGERLCRGDSRHAGDQRVHRDGRRSVRLVGVGDVCRFVCKEKLIVAGTRFVGKSFWSL